MIIIQKNLLAWHVPAPLHADPPVADGHENSPHAVPVKYVSHAHVPVVVSQTPRFEHSAEACAVFELEASSYHAGLELHDRNEQSVPVYLKRKEKRREEEGDKN